jgi:hypothetical protein
LQARRHFETVGKSHKADADETDPLSHGKEGP